MDAVRLSDLLRRPVETADGTRVGHVSDLSILHGSEHPEVRRVFIRSADGVRSLDGEQLDLDRSPLHLDCSRSTFDQLDDHELGPTELRLGTDVIDAQIVDLSGHHLVRVSDVLLTPVGNRLSVVGVEVDFGAVLRRLGFRRLARRVPEQIVPWSDLHLTSRRGHEVQLESGSAHLVRRSASDFAHLLARLSTGHATDLLEQTPVPGAAEALDLSSDEVGRRLLASVPEATAQDLLDTLPTARADELRSVLADTALPRRRFHRTHGWKRHAPRTVRRAHLDDS